jgi:hypothetical protein
MKVLYLAILVFLVGVINAKYIENNADVAQEQYSEERNQRVDLVEEIELEENNSENSLEEVEEEQEQENESSAEEIAQEGFKGATDRRREGNRYSPNRVPRPSSSGMKNGGYHRG